MTIIDPVIVLEYISFTNTMIDLFDWMNLMSSRDNFGNCQNFL